MSKRSRAQSIVRGQVIRDPVDLRDLIYRPSLSVLPESFLSGAVDPVAGGFGELLTIRDQGDRPTCIGESLAALIDIQRIEAFRQRLDVTGAREAVQPASAGMLHAMALEVERNDRGASVDDIRNLRSGIKGFFNTGVCTEALWQKAQLAGGSRVGKAARSEGRFDDATVEAMKEARKVTLGAYYRVRSAINDYHAALNDAGGLYVAAEVHDGWRKENMKDGVIGPDRGGPAPAQGHAFVIVGYNSRGFLVFNSWGPDWGGYRLDDNSARLRGVALWPYADWAASVLDCWALRLAAPTPEAFRYSIQTQGLTDFTAGQAQVASPSVRRLEILGRYIHLDDGAHSEVGAYPSSRRSLRVTLDHLGDDSSAGGASNFDCVCLMLHGDASPTEVVMQRLLSRIPEDKRQRVYGMSLVWINGLLNGAATALQPLFDRALKIAKGRREDADLRIEAMTQPVGRAIWRDAKNAAAKAAEVDGDAFDALLQVTSLCEASSKPLHLVAEGAGSLLLAELLQTVARTDKAPRFRQVLASLTLVGPLSTAADYNRSIGPFVETWGDGRHRRPTIFKADHDFNERIAVGSYSRSWTDLVSRAFEERMVHLIGSPDFHGRLQGGATVKRLAAPGDRSGELDAMDVLLHKDVARHLRCITEYSASKLSKTHNNSACASCNMKEEPP